MATNNSPNTTLAGQTGSGTFVGSASPTITTPVIATINDVNGHPAFAMATGFTNADNYMQVTNAPAGASPELQVQGSSTDIALLYRAKGAGQNIFVSTNNIPQLWYSGTGYQHLTRWQIANTAATRTVTIPDQDGTLLMAGQAFNAVTTQSFASGSGTYTPTTGTKFAIFEMIGGGGSGGGTGATAAGQGVASAGGGGGGYLKLIATAAQMAGGVTYLVGAGGAAPAAGVFGNNGASTTLTISGGTAWQAGLGFGGASAGGIGSAAQVAGGSGGATALGTNATLIYSANGDNGLNGMILGISNYNQGGHGGNGINGVGGGRGGYSSTAAAGGAPGNSRGAGGGGSSSVQSGGALSAGAGATGGITVTEYIAT